MQTDLVGRVNNYKLPGSKGLLPLFEAIVNSIHAIEDSGRSDGRIDIYIERSTQGHLFEDSSYLEPIQGFTVKDNGIGFDDSHFESFSTSDTTFNLERGGKGIGRFSWLKAFNTVSISSVYKKNQIFCRREFDFKLSRKAIENESVTEILASNTETTVKLFEFKEEYRKKAPKKAVVLGNRIIEHCLGYFVSHAPTIRLIDEQADEEIILNDVFKKDIKVHSQKQTFTCKSHTFNLLSLRLYSASDDAEHKLCLCAHNREVESDKLSRRILQLRNKIQDENGSFFTYMGYVSSSYLDERVNSERTGFSIQEKATELEFEDEISKEEVVNEALSKVEEYLDSYLSSIAAESYERTTAYICEQRPQYRLLLAYKEAKLKRIALGLTEAQLDVELYKLYMELELEIKQKSKEILEAVEAIDEVQAKKDEYVKFIEESNALGKSKLVEYVVHRKVILEILEKRLFAGTDGRYNREQDIHEIIFPLRATSDQVPYDRQNLWIIDEKLSYHQYLASDVELRRYQGTSANSQKRPDIVIFDRPHAFIGDAYPYSSVVIIEFKRPMRNGYSDEDNPIQQVYEYAQLIRDGKATDIHGVQILVDDNTPFYAYIICTITAKIRNFADMIPLTPSPTGDGYFGYNSRYKTYIEIISFQKLVADAKKRNAVLFDKLNLRKE